MATENLRLSRFQFLRGYIFHIAAKLRNCAIEHLLSLSQKSEIRPVSQAPFSAKAGNALYERRR